MFVCRPNSPADDVGNCKNTLADDVDFTSPPLPSFFSCINTSLLTLVCLYSSTPSQALILSPMPSPSIHTITRGSIESEFPADETTVPISCSNT